MHMVRNSLQVLLVLASALTLATVGLVIGLQRDGMAADISAAVLASAEARSEIGVDVAEQVEQAVPALAFVPAVTDSIPDAVEVVLSAEGTNPWVEREVRARLGEDVEPMLFRLGDFVDTGNPLVDLAIQASPVVEVEPTVSTTSVVVDVLNTVGPLLVIASVALFVATWLVAGRARASILTGGGGLVAATTLAVLPTAAELDGALSAIAAAAVVLPSVVATIAIGSALVALRGVLAQVAVLPYRTHNNGYRGDEGVFDSGFEF